MSCVITRGGTAAGRFFRLSPRRDACTKRPRTRINHRVLSRWVRARVTCAPCGGPVATRPPSVFWFFFSRFSFPLCRDRPTALLLLYLLYGQTCPGRSVQRSTTRKQEPRWTATRRRLVSRRPRKFTNHAISFRRARFRSPDYPLATAKVHLHRAAYGPRVLTAVRRGVCFFVCLFAICPLNDYLLLFTHTAIRTQILLLHSYNLHFELHFTRAIRKSRSKYCYENRSGKVFTGKWIDSIGE